MELASLIRNIPDFPKPGINFKDITTLLRDAKAFQYVIDAWKTRYAGKNITAIVGADARGFIFGGALAYALGLPFIPVRKKGKLPYKTYRQEFSLEYGTDCVEIHTDALTSEDRVVIVDDLLATGGTIGAIVALLTQLGAEVVEVTFVIELSFLKGRDKLSGVPVYSLVEFQD